MKNTEGFNQSSRHIGEVDDYFLRWASGQAVIHQPSFGNMTETTKRILRYIRDNPGLTAIEYAAGLDVSSSKKSLNDFAAVGLLSATSPKRSREGVPAQPSRYTITPKGIAAIERTTVAGPKLNRASCDYEVYVPPTYNHDDFRPGSMDAYKLPSLTFEGRKYPRGVTA